MRKVLGRLQEIFVSNLVHSSAWTLECPLLPRSSSSGQALTSRVRKPSTPRSDQITGAYEIELEVITATKRIEAGSMKR